MFTRGISLGRWFGIEVKLDWSLLLVFFLVTFNLGAVAFPQWHPDWGPVLNWSVATTAAALFFLSVLAHEFSHALVAKAYGMGVRSITLFLFGGVANIERDPPTPGAEALIAAVGPVASLVLGLAFTSLGLALSDVSFDGAPTLALQQMGPVSTLLLWLGPINVILAIFNLLPGFPLDGGRILRAGLWGATRSLQKATRLASGVGQAFGWLLMLTGIAMLLGAHVPVLGGGLIQGLWLAFIGWFLHAAAVSSYRQLTARMALKGVPISKMMRVHQPAAIGAWQPVHDLVNQYILTSGDTAFPVYDADQLVGVVHADDVRKISGDEWPRTPVRTIMTPLSSLPVVSPGDDASEVAGMLGAARELVVMEGQRVLGLVQVGDLARWLELNMDERSSGGRWPRDRVGSRGVGR